MRTTIYYMSLLMIFMMPWEGTVVLPRLGTISHAMGFLVAALWVFSVCVTGRFRQPSPFHLFMFLFVAWNAASLLWSIDPDETLHRLFVYVRMTGLVLIIWDLYRTPASITAAIQVYVFGAYIQVLSTVMNFMTGISAAYERYAATGTNGNVTAMLLGLSIPLAWRQVLLPATNPIMRVLRLVNTIFILVALFAISLTATRFALIMLLPALIFVLATLLRLRPALRVPLLIGIAGVLCLLPFFIPETALQRLQTIPYELAHGNLTGRVYFWQAGFDIWAHNPLMGIGSAAFHTASTPYFNEPVSAHSTFVATLAELGLIGFTLLSIMLASAVAHAWHHPKWDAAFWLTLLIVWGLGNTALTFIHTKATWLLLGLLVTSAHSSRHATPKVTPNPHSEALEVISR